MIIEVKDLVTEFKTSRGILKALDRVSLNVNKGEFVGIVGESGCGKSTLAYSIMRLIRKPGRIVSGSIIFEGKDLLKLSEEEMRKIRGKDIGMVFQDPMTSLDPLERIGDQFVEMLTEHGVDEEEAEEIAKKSLENVGLPAEMFHNYPHQLSGGQRQRVVIAMAVAMNPKLLIADEPTTALDVIVQEKIMDLLEELKKGERSILLITHDFSLAAERSDKIAVMYAGWIVEYGDAERVVSEPLHPYSAGLISSVPDLWLDREIKPLPGSPPDLVNPPEGCRFRDRCPKAMEICKKEPVTVSVGDRIVKCWLYGEGNVES
ncbi:oligopeptide/dipeptide ABC transporter, ATPase subunit [Ferroglobus placidus DSM 10642]|uniref:Nickel import system ATP-binding protein NikD n=1 Tax=Ferroglobus placidus (strain DSM 10642 / AEDII12DO) TaxID=589924 RepID=D3RYT7_FERPA|nr:ABC transporter ATP-binding protein [Ferroglobus placidus]ADC65650.1 oligopeptide/dipeptide ABC transporter, ATPase subunit [Ferroglobus placidus DSM 10642]